MIKNFFLLNRLVIDLNNKLPGFNITSAFSQEKDKVVFACRKGYEEVFIEISSDPLFPYIIIKENFTRAKKNVADIFNGIFPARIQNISIAEGDRIIRISLDQGELFFYIRGNKTNIIAASEKLQLSFRKTNQEQITILLKEFRNLKFINSFYIVDFSSYNYTNDKNFLRDFPYISKDILNEAKLRDTDNLVISIQKVITEIGEDNPAVFWNDTDVKLAFQGFQLYRDWQKEIIPDLIEAVKKFIIKKYSEENFLGRKKSLLSSVEQELEKTASRINNLRGRLDAGSKEEEYNKTANLLLININNFYKGTEEISLQDIYNDNQMIKISIDPSLSPGENAERYFEKARSERINYIKSKELYESSVKNYNELKEKQRILAEAEKPEEIKQMEKKKEVSTQGDKDDLKSKFRQYLIDGKYRVFIGRDSEKNDLLTMKFAKQNDYWFHARSVPGSHVVLRVDNAKESVPKSILKKAAALAAFHSKAKTSSLAPVSYTLKKYVSKKKGMEPGKVSLMREEVILIKPEIPAGCEYLSTD